MKKYIIALIILLCCLPLISCSQADVTADSVSMNKTKLAFRITWTDYSGRGQAIKKIVDTYNDEYSDTCTIEMIGGNEDSAEIGSLLKNEDDMIFVLPYRYVQYFGDLGYLMALNDSFKNDEALFYPDIWALGTVDDAVCGIPWLGHSMCILYNNNLLDEAGVDPSSIKSLDTLVNAIEQVEAHTDARGFGLVGADCNDVSWMVNQFIYGFGGSLVSGDGLTVAINSDESVSALEFYKCVLGQHAQATWVEDDGEAVMSYFRNQEVAFEIQGIWGVTDIAKNGAPFEVGIIPMQDVGLCSEVGPMMLAIPATMSNEMKEEAVQFISYMISMTAQEDILNGEYSPEHDTYYPFRTPIRIDMADSQIVQSNPEYMTFIEGFQNPSLDVPVPAWQTVKDELYETGLHQVMNDEVAIDEFLSIIETEGSRILNGS